MTHVKIKEEETEKRIGSEEKEKRVKNELKVKTKQLNGWKSTKNSFSVKNHFLSVNWCVYPIFLSSSSPPSFRKSKSNWMKMRMENNYVSVLMRVFLLKSSFFLLLVLWIFLLCFLCVCDSWWSCELFFFEKQLNERKMVVILNESLWIRQKKTMSLILRWIEAKNILSWLKTYQKFL